MKNRPQLFPILFIILLCFFIFFINNEMIIPDIMEARNMITANEMVYDGHWLIPTMNGELRLEKPPLPTWISAMAELIAPAHLGIQRAMSGLAATLLSVFYYLLALQFFKYKRFAWISTLIFITCFNVFLIGRTASWDIYCHAFMLVAIYLWIRAFKSPNTLFYFMGAGIFMGLSFLSKGPVSFYALLLPFLIAYSIFYRPNMRGKWLGMIAMLFFCIVVGGWWYAYIHAFHYEELQYVIKKESGAWINHSVRPWYYYWRFFLETGIWSILMLTALFLPAWSKEVRHKRSFLFIYIWMLLTLFLLSCLPEKKTRYLFPILIPSCYLMGYLVVYWYNKFNRKCPPKKDVILYRFNAWMMGIVVALIPIGGVIFLYKDGHVGLFLLLLLTLFIEIIAIFLMRFAVRLQPINMVGAIVVLFITLACFVLPLLKNVVNNSEIHSISQVREMEELNNIPFYYKEDNVLRIEIVYAAGRKIRPTKTTDVDSLMSLLPFVWVTPTSVQSELPSTFLQQVDTIYIDKYDDNRWSKSDKRYKPEFINNAILLKCK